MHRRIVLDANILLRAVLGKKVPELLASYSSQIVFAAPTSVFEEAARHIPRIAESRSKDASQMIIASIVCATLSPKYHRMHWSPYVQKH